MVDSKDETNPYKSESELPITHQIYKVNGKNYLNDLNS